MTRHELGGGLSADVSSATDVGAVRAVNEDAILVAPPVFAVADGMGGHAFGDRASAAAVAGLRRALVEAHRSLPDPDAVLAAVASANREVRALTDDTDVIAGTTLAAVVAVDVDHRRRPRWMVVHVGDSRVYAWDGIVLELLTRDHSLVQEMQDAGVLDAAGAERHPDRNVVTRALGAADEVDPGVLILGADEGRELLICSDGLTKELSDDAIAALLAGGADAQALVAAAIAAGGRDNVSVVLVHPEFAGLATDDADEQTAEHGADDTRDRPLRELEDTRPRA